MMALRNESPPPGVTDDELRLELIGDSSYSKLGCIELIQSIMGRLVRYCSSEESGEAVHDEFEFDDELCKFMDMTVDVDVLHFVREIAFIEPLCHAISINRSDRFNELFIGILSNFASDDVLCHKITGNLEIVDLFISFWSSDYPSFLLECSRLIKIVLKNPSCFPVWLQVIKSNENFLNHIIFILNSSTNGELLISTLQVVGQLMKLDDELCEKWISHELLSAALVARKETEWFLNNDIDYFHYLIHLFSTNENGIVTLISNFHAVYASFNEYLNKICDEEPHLIIIGQCHNSLRLILPTIDVVVANMATEEALNLLQSEPTVLDNLVRLVYSCSLQSEKTAAQEVYLEISSFFNTIIGITYSNLESRGDSESPQQVRWLQSIDVGACLPQLQAFLACCTQNDSAKVKLLEITKKLSLTYLHEAMTDLKIK